MSLNKILSNPALKTHKHMELNEEWNNFVKRIGEVTGLVKDMASGDKAKADAAFALADQYLEGKVILDEDVKMTIKDNRTVINQKAFQSLEKKQTDEINKHVWMAEMSKDAEQRAQDRKIRREKADTLKTQAIKAFRRGDYDRALTCYNRAIDQVRDNPMLYCDRALTNIKLENYEKVIGDCDLALRLNENSFKARLYKAKAFQELEEVEKLKECRQEIEEKFPQHQDLVKYFLDKKDRDIDEN